jgi:hypothetical protein
LVAILLLVGITVLGAGSALFVYNVVPKFIPSGAWSRIDLGQEKAVRILGADSSSQGIYFGTESGDIYACGQETGYPPPANQCNKVTIEQVPKEQTECVERFAIPSPPGEVVDSRCYPAYFGGQVNIVILGDGSVWHWAKYGGEMGGIAEVLGGTGIGLLVGLVVAGLWMDRRTHSSRRET